MKTEKILILLGIGLLLYAFLSQPLPDGAPEWQEIVFISNRPGSVEMKATAIISENYEEMSFYISKIEVQDSEDNWRSIITGSTKIDLTFLQEQETVIGSNKLEPGEYSNIRVEVTGVEVKDMSGRKSDLYLKNPIVEIPFSFTVLEEETTYITLTFDTMESISANFFTPVIYAE